MNPKASFNCFNCRWLSARGRTSSQRQGVIIRLWAFGGQYNPAKYGQGHWLFQQGDITEKSYYSIWF